MMKILSIVFVIVSLAVVSSWPNTGPKLSGRRRRGLRSLTGPTCAVDEEFSVFVDELDLDGKALDEANFKEIPNNGVSNRGACKAQCSQRPDVTDCQAACDCKWDCKEGTPGQSLGVEDIVYDRCLVIYNNDVAFCTRDCEQRCRGTYNNYVLTIGDDPDKYFAGNATQECALLDSTAACQAATDYWVGSDEDVVCDPDPLTGIDCFCQTAAPTDRPSASPTDSPSASPSASPTPMPSQAPSAGDCRNICSACSANADGTIENGVFCCNDPTPEGICKGGGLVNIGSNDLCCNGKQSCKGLTIQASSSLTLIQCSGHQACKDTDFTNAAASNACCMQSSSCALATGFDERRNYY